MRHGLAGVAASIAFLALYFGLSLKLVIAAPASLLVYLGVMMSTVRRAPPTERMLAPDVSEAALREAVASLRSAGQRLAALGPKAPLEVADALEEMSGRLFRIAEHHERDPRDLKHTRNFIRHDLERMIETCERFVDLAARSDPTDGKRLWPIGERIRSFAPALAKFEEACLENDFMQLEVEADVLSSQIGR